MKSPFDLHVLGTPPAFILSQDQTLMLKWCLCPASFIWHCLLLIRVACQSFDQLACSWISLKILEFSGLHYCLFVKDHNLLLRKSSFIRCCCSQRQLWYLIITAFVCQQLFWNLFSSWKTLFSVTDIYVNISVQTLQQLFLKSFQVSFELLCCLGAASTTNLSISSPTVLVNTIFRIFCTNYPPATSIPHKQGIFAMFLFCFLLFYKERKLLSELFHQICQIVIFIQTCKYSAVSGIIYDHLAQGSQVSEDIKCVYCPNN